MEDVEKAKVIRSRIRTEQGVQAVSSNAVETIARRGQNTRLGHAIAAEKVAEKVSQMDGDELFMSGQLLQQHAKHAALTFGWESGNQSVTVNLAVLGDHLSDCPSVE